MKLWVISVISLTLVAGVVMLVVGGRARAPAPVEPSLEAFLDPSTGDFASADTPWTLSLPEDHGAHPHVQGELWGISFWLRDQVGAGVAVRVGLERLALRARPIDRQSEWAANQLYSGQVLLLASDRPDPEVRTRVQRAALGLAGAAREPARIWVDDWSLKSMGQGAGLEVEILSDGLVMDLGLTPGKPPLSDRDLQLFSRGQGLSGLHGYAMTRLKAQGSLNVDGRSLPVEGTAWLDHLWGNLGEGRASLAPTRIEVQLDDGRDLLCVELRHQDGSGRPIPACALILQDGRVQSFQRREIGLEVTRYRSSETQGRRYAVAWRLTIPLIGVDLDVTPLDGDRSADFPAVMWSGRVRISGRQGGQRIVGQGWADVGGVRAPAH